MHFIPFKPQPGRAAPKKIGVDSMSLGAENHSVYPISLWVDCKYSVKQEKKIVSLLKLLQVFVIDCVINYCTSNDTIICSLLMECQPRVGGGAGFQEGAKNTGLMVAVGT